MGIPGSRIIFTDNFVLFCLNQNKNFAALPAPNRCGYICLEAKSSYMAVNATQLISGLDCLSVPTFTLLFDKWNKRNYGNATSPWQPQKVNWTTSQRD